MHQPKKNFPNSKFEIPNSSFHDPLSNWFTKNGRDLPWRKTKNPYHIWVSEIMLQQTQVERVKVFYERFLVRFSTMRDLAEASWEEVLECWRGLGYYRRARNLHQTAQIIVKEYGGVFPSRYDELRKLSGIGAYTAAAISSFAFDQDLAALDTNLKRVLSRVLGEKFENISEQKRFHMANSLIQKGQGAVFNHALMDLGATICRSMNPQCTECPLSKVCFFYKHKKLMKTDELDQKVSYKPSILLGKNLVLADKVYKGYGEGFEVSKDVFDQKNVMKVAAGVVIAQGKVLITKRPDHVYFARYWEFPGGKLERNEDERACLKRELQEEVGIEVSVRPSFYRTLTYQGDQPILLSFHRCSLLSGEPKAFQVAEFLWVSPEDLKKFKFPPANDEAIEILLQKKAMWRS